MTDFNLKPLLEKADGVTQDKRYTRIDLRFGTSGVNAEVVGASVVLKVDRKEYDKLKTKAQGGAKRWRKRKRSDHKPSMNTSDKTTSKNQQSTSSAPPS